MMKFFRKHNKKLLAVFMAGLLVVWLGGSALQSVIEPDQSGKAVALCRYGKIVEADRWRAEGVTTLLSALRIPWSQPGLAMNVPSQTPLTLYEWILLVREAKEMGFEADPAQAQQQLLQNRSQDEINLLAVRSDVAPEALYVAAADFLSVLRAMQAVAEAGQISEAQLRAKARDYYEKAEVRLVTLKGEAFVDPEQPLSEDELQALFEKHRDQERGKGIDFGYYLPPRVKVQYVKVDTGKIVEAIKERQSDEQLLEEAYNYWKANPQDPAFRRSPPQPPKLNAQDLFKLQPGQPPKPEPELVAEEEDIDLDMSLAPELGDKPDADAGDSGDEQPDPDKPSGSERQSAPNAAGQPPIRYMLGPEDEPTEPPAADSPTAKVEDAPAVDRPSVAASPSEVVPPAPVKAEPSPYFEKFEEAREAALAKVRQLHATREADAAASAILEAVLAPWGAMAETEQKRAAKVYETDPEQARQIEDDYKPRPEDVDAEDYLDELLKRLLVNEPAVRRYSDAISVATTDWFTAEEAASVADIGQARLTDFEDPPNRFGQLAFLVQGVEKYPPREAKVDRSLYLALFETNPYRLKDAQNNLYIYRVVAAETGRAPSELAEVRDRVEQDLRLLKGYERAEQKLKELLAAAQSPGLKTAWDSASELQEAVKEGQFGGYDEPKPFSRTKPPMTMTLDQMVTVKGLGFLNDEIRAKIFELAKQDQPEQTGFVRQVIPLPDRAAVMLAEWRGVDRVDQSQYVQQRGMLLAWTAYSQHNELLGQWLDPELIRSRNRYTTDVTGKKADTDG